MTTRTRTRQARRTGLTLVELLVAMVLFAVAGTIALTTLITVSESTRAGTERSVRLADIQTAMERMSRDLRAARPLLLDPAGAYGTALGAVVYRDDSRVEYRWRVEENDEGGLDLRQDRRVFRPEDSDIVTTASSNALVTRVTNGPDEPLFRYYAADGSEITCNGTSSDCRSQHLAARQIELTFLLELDEQDDPLVSSTRTGVRNTRLN